MTDTEYLRGGGSIEDYVGEHAGAVEMGHAPSKVGLEAQPISSVTWTPRDDLHANDYNPNKVAPRELRLLKVSIMEDGWTQPIVATENREIVDGFHRWSISADPDVRALTDGMVPVVFLRGLPPDQQRMATVRHNRARGSHYVVSMADIMKQLTDSGLSPDEIGHRLQMEPEEITRLLERGRMIDRKTHQQRANPHALNGDEIGFTEAWAPTRKGADDDLTSKKEEDA